MKRFFLLPVVALSLTVAGCASYSGGTAEDAANYNDTGLGPENSTIEAPGSGTQASPTFRSGLHPNDIRDPNALIWPRPYRGMR